MRLTKTPRAVVGLRRTGVVSGLFEHGQAGRLSASGDGTDGSESKAQLKHTA